MMKKMNPVKKAAVVLALSTTCIPVVAQAARVDVELQVSGNALIVTGNSKQCEGEPIDCIEVAKKTSPNIFLYLDNACGTGSGAPQYKLTGISLSMIKGVPVGPANPLPSVVAGDFDADAANGAIKLPSGQLSNDRIFFKNKNSQQYTVFYEITASPCSGSGAPIKLDPSIRNQGGGGGG
jgi:hypothetical protein